MHPWQYYNHQRSACTPHVIVNPTHKLALAYLNVLICCVDHTGTVSGSKVRGCLLGGDGLAGFIPGGTKAV
jgi:hypothetical protein